MKWGWKGTCIKYTLLLLNLFLFAFGIVLLALGSWSLQMGRLGQFMSVPPLSIGLIILGTALAVITFFGCCGAGKENRVLLGVVRIFIIFVSLIFICQLGVGIAGLTFQGQIKNVITEGWNSSTPEFKDYVEENFYCCGFISYEEEGIDPATCPHPDSTRGCYDSLVDYFGTRIVGVMTVAIIFAVIQLICVGLAIYFFKSIHKKVEDRRDLLAESRRINNFYRRDRRGV